MRPPVRIPSAPATRQCELKVCPAAEQKERSHFMDPPRPARLAFPAPEKLEALAVPTDEGFGPHDHQCDSPIEPIAEPNEGQAGWMGGPSGLDSALLVDRELFAQEKILGCE